jgi:hypothetical protein
VQTPVKTLTPTLIFGLVVGCSVVLVLASQAFTALHTATNDATLFAYGGKLILKGLVPYRDFWDNKPPAVFYTQALGFALGGGHWLGPTVLHALFAVATVLVMARVFADAHERWLPRAFGLVLAAAAIANPFVTQGGHLTETFQLLPSACSLWLLCPLSPKIRALRYFLAGALAALAFLYKPTGAAVAVVALMAALLHVVRGRWTLRDAAEKLGIYAAGGVLMLVLVTLGFAFAGSAADFWFATLEYNVTAYRELFPWRTPSRLRALFEPFRNDRFALNALGLCFVLAPLSAVLRRKYFVRDERTDDVMWIGLAWAAADQGLAYTARNAFPHYFNPLALSLPFLASSLASLPPRELPRFRLSLLVPALFALLVGRDWILMLIRQHKELPLTTATFTEPTGDELLAERVRSFLRTDEKVFGWGHHQAPQLALDRLPATELLSSLHLGSRYGWGRWGGQYERALAARPSLILDTSGDLAREPPRAARNSNYAGFFAELDAVTRRDYVLAAETRNGHRAFVRRDLWVAPRTLHN